MTTLSQLLGQTNALKPAREAHSHRARIQAAKAAAPTEATQALAVYRASAGAYVERVSELIQRHATDPSGLGAALERLRPPVRRVGRLAQAHARRELSRALGQKIPAFREGDSAVIEAFVAEQGRLFSKLAFDVEAALVRNGPEAAARVARNRAELIASDQVFKVAAEATSHYARAVGAEEYVWVTRDDRRVRPGHAALHNTVQRWDSPPSSGRGEVGPPGTAIHCRCAAAPLKPPAR